MNPAVYLVVSNDTVALLEWFVASVALVMIVTLVYILLLNKSPPPEGPTQAKLESVQNQSRSGYPDLIISDAENAIKNGDNGKAVELAVDAARASLMFLMARIGVKPSNMNISDMAYLVQSKASKSPDITQPMYQLNLMHLKAVQLEVITPQEAQWAVSTSAWLSQIISAQQISF